MEKKTTVAAVIEAADRGLLLNIVKDGGCILRALNEDSVLHKSTHDGLYSLVNGGNESRFICLHASSLQIATTTTTTTIPSPSSPPPVQVCTGVLAMKEATTDNLISCSSRQILSNCIEGNEEREDEMISSSIQHTTQNSSSSSPSSSIDYFARVEVVPNKTTAETRLRVELARFLVFERLTAAISAALWFLQERTGAEISRDLSESVPCTVQMLQRVFKMDQIRWFEKEEEEEQKKKERKGPQKVRIQVAVAMESLTQYYPAIARALAWLGNIELHILDGATAQLHALHLGFDASKACVTVSFDHKDGQLCFFSPATENGDSLQTKGGSSTSAAARGGGGGEREETEKGGKEKGVETGELDVVESSSSNIGQDVSAAVFDMQRHSSLRVRVKIGLRIASICRLGLNLPLELEIFHEPSVVSDSCGKRFGIRPIAAEHRGWMMNTICELAGVDLIASTLRGVLSFVSGGGGGNSPSGDGGGGGGGERISQDQREEKQQEITTETITTTTSAAAFHRLVLSLSVSFHRTGMIARVLRHVSKKVLTGKAVAEFWTLCADLLGAFVVDVERM